MAILVNIKGESDMKKKILSCVIALLLCFPFGITVFAENQSKAPRLVDNAGILSNDDIIDLTQKLDELSEREKIDVAIVTVKSLEGTSLMNYADDFYDENGYGFGENYDGVLYLINVDNDGEYYSGNSWISTCGYAITVFTDAGIQYIGETITPDLLNGDFTTAFNTYIDLADDFILQAKTDVPYDVDNLPNEPFPVVLALIFSLIIGFIISFIATCIMKGKLKTVHENNSAVEYFVKDSLKVTSNKDVFLYSHVDRIKKAESSSGGSRGGSSTHTSSSGRSHGGGGF